MILQEKSGRKIYQRVDADQEFLRKERIFNPDGNYLKGQSVVVRHIHGDINKPADICLGFEHYINITQKLRNMFSPIFRYDVFWKNGLTSSNEHLHNNQYKVYVPDTWAFRFFVDDMDIAGFGLPSSETDIWWLLAYRAKQYYIGEKILQGRKNPDSEHVIREYINNKIYYHDIIPISNKRMMDDSEKKRRVFETFKVEYRRYIVDDWSDFAFAYGEIARMIAERLEGNESMEIVEGKEVPQWSFDFTNSDNISINDE